MGRDQHALAGLHLRGDHLFPERDDARDGVLQAFGQRQFGRRERRVARIVAGAARIGRFERGRRRVVAAAPHEDLLLAVLRGRLGLVQTLQPAVVTFVQAPVVAHGQPHHVHLVEGDPERADRALQHRDVREVESVTERLQEPAGLARFLAAEVGQVDVGPAGEAVLLVPGAFPVPDQHDLVRHSRWSS